MTARKVTDNARSGDGSASGHHCAPENKLCLGTGLRARLQALARAGYPEETCGLLLGRCTENQVEVLELVPARNLNRERARDRYELDPTAFLAADTQAREHGWEVVGIWHTHPDHPAKPSATDRAKAWEGWSYLILSVSQGGVNDLRSWRMHAGDFIEEVIK